MPDCQLEGVGEHLISLREGIMLPVLAAQELSLWRADRSSEAQPRCKTPPAAAVFLPMYQCTNVPMYQCTNVPMCGNKKDEGIKKSFRRTANLWGFYGHESRACRKAVACDVTGTFT